MKRVVSLVVFIAAIAATPRPAIAQNIVVDPSDFTSEKIADALAKKGKDWVKGQAKSAGKDWIFSTGESDTMHAIFKQAENSANNDPLAKERGGCRGAALSEASSILVDMNIGWSFKTGAKLGFDTVTKIGGLASGFGGAVVEGGAIDWVLGQYANAATGKAKDSVFDEIKKLFIKEQKPQFEIFDSDGKKGQCDYKVHAVWDIVHGTYTVLLSGDCHCTEVLEPWGASQKVGKWWVKFEGHVKLDANKQEKTANWVVLDPAKPDFDAQCPCPSDRQLRDPFAEKMTACPPPAKPQLSAEERAKIQADIDAKTDALQDEESNAVRIQGKYDAAVGRGDEKAIKEAKNESYESQFKQTQLKKQIDALKKRLADAAPAPAKSKNGVSYDLDPFAQRILNVHNAERAAVGSPPLEWSPVLAAHATAYAAQLANDGQLAHASRENRGTERENLSQGNLWWTTDQLMQNWLGEKKHFVGGTFPNVSDTGNWVDVGHYTQMIWSSTTELGCGEARGSGFSWLVCRYSPGGNKDGQPVLGGSVIEIAAPPCPEDDSIPSDSYE